MDPQQRLLLEYSHLALIDAGEKDLEGANAGIFVGIIGIDADEVKAREGASGVYSANGTSHSTAAGRISFVFGLQGPAISYDTACSSALVALHAAARCLQNGDCELALVAGVNVMLTSTVSKAYATVGMTSPTGRCHTFDASADGYVRAEGCGVIVLKQTQTVGEHQHMHSIIQGASVAQDGTSASLTAPNGKAQEKLMAAALWDAQLVGSGVDYLEAHGTGTPLGDPIEMKAVAAVMGQNREDDCVLVMGAVKANIGHSEAAAGIAGLLKAVLVLQHELSAPNPELKTLNPKIEAVTKDIEFFVLKTMSYHPQSCLTTQRSTRLWSILPS